MSSKQELRIVTVAGKKKEIGEKIEKTIKT